MGPRASPTPGSRVGTQGPLCRGKVHAIRVLTRAREVLPGLVPLHLGPTPRPFPAQEGARWERAAFDSRVVFSAVDLEALLKKSRLRRGWRRVAQRGGPGRPQPLGPPGPLLCRRHRPGSPLRPGVLLRQGAVRLWASPTPRQRHGPPYLP